MAPSIFTATCQNIKKVLETSTANFGWVANILSIVPSVLLLA